MADVESRWAKIRTSNSFVWGLLAFSATYAFLNLLYRFDPDWGLYNTLYSTEASISNAVITAMFVRQFDLQQKQDLHALHIAEAIMANSEESRRREEWHAKTLKEHGERIEALHVKVDALSGSSGSCCSSGSSSG